MKRSGETSGRSIRPPRSPVIAIRVPAPVHKAITKAAKNAGMTMSDYMQQLITRGQEWQDIIGDARKLLEFAKAEAKRIVDGTLQVELHRRNWKRDLATGGWIPPEVHGLPADGFIKTKPAEAERAVARKKRRVR